MKKYFVVVFALTLVFLLMSCKDSKKETPPGFVYIEDGVFKIDSTVFFPLMINYKVEVRQIGDDVVISAAGYYENGTEKYTKEEINNQFSNHVELINELGFNSMRICLDVIMCDEIGYYYKSLDDKIYLNDECDKIIDGIADMVEIAASHNIKVMLLLKPAFDEELMMFTSKVMRRFADNPAIFAYDLMNEPLYFDPEPKRKKMDAFRIVSRWRDAVRENAPNHLFTIGFAEPIEVFEWDASILPVDFVQIHTYHPLRIPNEIWWYSHYIGKPWMIGETSLPSDNDSVSYELQCRFVEEVYQHTINCGGIGFGWWEFQDVLSEHVNFEANYAGLLSQEGVTYTKSGKEIKGSLKPAAYEFKNLCELKPQKPVKPVNYYNMLGYENYIIKGRIVYRKKPVEGAVVRGWNKYWRVGMNTYTDENGEFTLYSNDSCIYFEISAPGKNKLKFDSDGLNLKYRSVDGSNNSYTDLKNVNLEYQNISYFPFLKNDTMLFEFKHEMFDKARFITDMGVLKLKRIK
ncbi:MAG: hypothetical protein IJK92_04810 [Bacteroidales bacterium]|nr:hypothetical protein [Bacteroidales bacterium]